MEFVTLFDVVVVSLVLILGIKGVISGLIKEIFGLVGLIGGIVVASRFAAKAGQIISDKVYKLDGDTVVFFAGFLSTLIVFWVVCLGIGAFLSKLVGLSGLGFLDKLGGFAVGSAKIFLVFAVLIVTVSNIQVLNNKIEPYFAGSKLYPVLLETGKWIMNVDVKAIAGGVGNIETPFDAAKQEHKPNLELNSTI